MFNKEKKIHANDTHWLELERDRIAAGLDIVEKKQKRRERGGQKGIPIPGLEPGSTG